MAVDALARAIAAGKVPVTAYELAVKAGYTGTEEQFAEDMGNSGTNAANAAASASAAAASAESVSASAAQIATNTSDISDLKESLNLVFPDSVKKALLDCFNYVAWKGDDPNGSVYIDSLETALYPDKYRNMNYLFDDIKLTDGYINDNGEIVIDGGGDKLYNKLIPAIGFCLIDNNGGIYKSNTILMRLSKYNSDEEFIGRFNANTYAVTADTNTKYIKMGFSNGDTVLNNAVGFAALNILDTNMCTIPDSNIDSDGNVEPMSGVSLSNFLPIGNHGYIVGMCQDTSDTIVVAFFDKDKQIISRNTIVPPTDTKYGLAFEIPNNAAFVRFRCATTPDKTQYISYTRFN
jgi:hypothetical protein